MRACSRGSAMPRRPLLLLLLLVLVLLACVACLAAPAFVQVNPDTRFFVDPQGRSRIFHGVNAVYKISPWVPSTDSFDPATSLSEIDYENLASWGFTAVRLGTMWPGVEPAQKHYNQTYLDQIESIVNGLGARGIYTILDMHQDVLSRYFCGEGIPDWAVEGAGLLNGTLKFPQPLPVSLQFDPATHYPQLNSCLAHSFGMFYFSEEVAAGFQSLYENVNGLGDQHVAFWIQVATRFASNPYVLGYELINEPFNGNIFAHPSLLLSGLTDKQLLAPMYQRLHSAIRAVDDQHIIFFEPCVFDLGQSGFELGPGGPEYNDRQAYSYHIYCGASGDPRNMFLCNETDSYLVKEKMASDLKRIGVAGFMTEFGAVNVSENAVEDLHNIAGYADQYLQSWTYWQFKLFNDLTTASSAESLYGPDGTVLETKLKALTRTHAQAVAGVPLIMTFDPLSGAFELQYQVDLSISAPTVLFLHQQYYYPNGFTLLVHPENAVQWSQPGTNLVYLSQPSVPHGTNISVFISPSSATAAL